MTTTDKEQLRSEYTRFNRASSVRTFAILALLLYPTTLMAQAVPAAEKIELEDSRGNALTDELTVGRGLGITVEQATPGASYRFELITANGEVVDEIEVQAGPEGLVPKARLFPRSNIQGDGWTDPVGSPGEILGPYSNLSEASAELDGLTLWLSAEVKLEDPAGPGSWSTILFDPITMREPQEATYYWSTSRGDEDCFAHTGEPVYLSVYNAHLEDFEYSQVFMIEVPEDKEAWQDWNGDEVDAPEFILVRHREGCQLGPDEDCFYDNGSFEHLPKTVTIAMAGLLPASGEFLAVVRPSDSEGNSNEGRRLFPCDRATEGALFIKEKPIDKTDAHEGWGCPPCAGL